MKIDILGGSAENKYKNLNSQKTINWYLVPGTQAEANKSQKSMFPTPGLPLYATADGRYHRGAYVARSVGLADRCFFVVDTTLYELGTDATITSRGSLSNMAYGFTRITMKVNGNNHMFIGHPSASYDFDLTTNTLVQITDVDYPGMETADYMDGYLLVSKSGRTYFNNVLNDFTSWDGSDVLTPTFKADGVVAVGVIKEELYNFGSETIEPYLNDGTSPFSRRSGATVLYGLAAKDSLCVFNDGFLFLGKNDRGQFAVYHMGYDYSINQISDMSRNWLLNNTSGPVEEAYAFIQYTKDGHIWYHITIPTLHTTLVYDIMTKEWFERQSKRPAPDSDGTDIWGEFRGKYHVSFNGLNLFFDMYSGKIFSESYTTFTEDSLIIKRIRTSQIYDQERRYISTSDLEIDCNTGEAAVNTGQGSDPILMLEISRDGGRTFGSPRHISVGALGKFTNRAKINRLGTARSWVLRLTLTDPIDLMIQSAVANGTISGPPQA